MRSASFERHQIQIIREYEDVPPIMTDRHKVVQIFVNLVGNAKHAMSENGDMGGTMTLRLFKVNEDRVRFDVTDDGMGISQENLAKIFSFGFTTKKDGHGFGLHTSALAAKEMGGSLTATSDGEGKGATFSLEIPIHQDAFCEVGT